MEKLLLIILLFILEMTLHAADSEAESSGMNYMVLVNRQHPLPEGWESALETVSIINSCGENVEVEKKAFKAYHALAADLEQEDGIQIELDSARRSIAEQQNIRDCFTGKYGTEYTHKYVADPGYSEHHTGLALDLYFRMDGLDICSNEDMTKDEYLWVWERIHARLAKHGFILRYPKGRDSITGYAYEPWHIRYIDSPETAAEIMEKDITLEEYLDKQPLR